MGLEVYYEAFQELNTCRAQGLSAGPIPWTAVDAYARRHGYDEPEDFAYLLEMVRALDDALLKHLAEKRGNDNGGNR